MTAAGRSAAVVIVGGGVLGCSIAWHLARAGQPDVLVVERNELGSGATARSAGLVSRGRLHAGVLAMVRRTREAMVELERILGEPVGFRRVGSLRIAASEERAAELAAMDALLREHGVEVLNPDARQAQSLAPWLDLARARHVSQVPDDGFVDAHQLTQAYARAARALGVRFQARTGFAGLRLEAASVVAVETDHGRISAGTVVLAAGAWTIPLAGAAGYGLATAPVRSHYWITAPHPAHPREHPVVYLPDARAYLRPEVGGLLMGIQEPESRTFDARAIPGDVSGYDYCPGEDFESLIAPARALREWIPRLDELPIAHHIAGFSTYTPDGRFLLGALEGLPRCFVASGCCGTGVSASGGIGAAIAALVLGQAPFVDLAPFRPERFGSVDPYDAAFRARCAAARAGKSRRMPA